MLKKFCNSFKAIIIRTGFIIFEEQEPPKHKNPKPETKRKWLPLLLLLLQWFLLVSLLLLFLVLRHSFLLPIATQCAASSHATTSSVVQVSSVASLSFAIFYLLFPPCNSFFLEGRWKGGREGGGMDALGLVLLWSSEKFSILMSNFISSIGTMLNTSNNFREKKLCTASVGGWHWSRLRESYMCGGMEEASSTSSRNHQLQKKVLTYME